MTDGLLLERIVVVGGALSRGALVAELPHLPIEPARRTPAAAVEVDAARWPAAMGEVDAEVAARRTPFTLALRASGEATGLALAVATRYQRLAPRRNLASRQPAFQRLLARHLALHDLGKPLVRADWEHAIDTWQWLLRLDPQASLPAQAAALFHDVERLVSEPDARIEHLARDYQAFKDAHARGGAELARGVLSGLDLDGEEVERALALIAAHERPAGDRELLDLNDADALSFFSLNSGGFLDYYGPAHTRRKVRYSLARMRPPARARLAAIALRPDVAAIVREAIEGHESDDREVHP